MLIANMSMSLDGFVEDRNGDVGTHLFGWTQAGEQTSAMPGDGRTFRTSRATAAYIEESVRGLGAMITGRRLFDLARGWGGQHPTGVPVFVVTHCEPTDWQHPEAPFTFVTQGGTTAAVEQATAAAAGRNVAVASADIARQCLELGLLDAIAVDLVPVLLGAGKPWFAGLSNVVHLSVPTVIEGSGVTHLGYLVQRG